MPTFCPADGRINSFLARHFAHLPKGAPTLPCATATLDRPGLAREWSLPAGKHFFESPLLKSYRVRQGVLHNPAKDRRTTAGVFHVCEGGQPIPADKLAVPPQVFANLFHAAFDAPPDLLRIPLHADGGDPSHAFASLLLRPAVVPAVPGFIEERRMEIRFFAPGSLVSNLDFVESIFGNAGDPHSPTNDAALDPLGWTGHTGAVIIAPHLTALNKKDLGLPHISVATERQKRDGMCWQKEDERYNGGNAFKCTLRDESGVIVTLIADNYYGYCKKEVKTMISFSANLHGLAEEEHAGGAVARASYNLGDEFQAPGSCARTVADIARDNPDLMELLPGGHGIDRAHADIRYVPHEALFSIDAACVTWTADNGASIRLPLAADVAYLLPSGYQVVLRRAPIDGTWSLVGTAGEGVFCHKPCTVSGGGKSEISKSLSDAILGGRIHVGDMHGDFAAVEQLLARDFSTRFKNTAEPLDTRTILSPDRSLGSVIKLLTPSPQYTAAHNAFIEGIPPRVKELAFIIKRLHREGTPWRPLFTVDNVNGKPGTVLNHKNLPVGSRRLRVGYLPDGSWRTFTLRTDFEPAAKLQMEDDITASVIVPPGILPGTATESRGVSAKICLNCEDRLFQRPDEAIHRGYDKQTESDLATAGTFTSNFEPLSAGQVREMAADVARFSAFTAPMQGLLHDFAKTGKDGEYCMSSANPRLVDGKPSKNPRYLQLRQDLADPRVGYLTRAAARLARSLPATEAQVPFPVSAILAGRRNNPPEPGVHPLACYSPIHHLPVPEAMAEFITSMTGKSPSTTGAGSEGALTKGPFNALPGVADLNAAMLSFILAGQDVFISSAGCIGPQMRVDHDISLLVPEVWCRMSAHERRAHWLMAEGYLEAAPDFIHAGRTYKGSRLGYRITREFAVHFLGRIFTYPDTVFSDAMLRPETQDAAVYAESLATIETTDRRVAQAYFEDGTIAGACPPLRALLGIMAHGTHENMTMESPRFRAMFDRDAVLGSDWYAQRLETRRRIEDAHLIRGISRLEEALTASPGDHGLSSNLSAVLARRETAGAIPLIGSLGADPWISGFTTI